MSKQRWVTTTVLGWMMSKRGTRLTLYAVLRPGEATVISGVTFSAVSDEQHSVPTAPSLGSRSGRARTTLPSLRRRTRIAPLPGALTCIGRRRHNLGGKSQQACLRLAREASARARPQHTCSDNRAARDDGVVNHRPKEDVMKSAPLVDCAGRRRSPATLPGYHRGRPPRNKGLRYPPDPPTVEEIIAVMRAAGDEGDGVRLRGVIVVLWRAGLNRAPDPIQIALGQRERLADPGHSRVGHRTFRGRPGSAASDRAARDRTAARAVSGASRRSNPASTDPA